MNKVSKRQSRKSHFINGVYSFLNDVFSGQIKKRLDVDCSEYPFSVIITGLVILLIVFVALYTIFQYARHYYPDFQNPSQESLHNSAGQSFSAMNASDIRIHDPRNRTSGMSGDCNLNNGQWHLWYGRASQDVNDRKYFILPINREGFLFYYVGEIEDITICEFRFIPRGESAINYVISLDGVYQIVVGDNDLWAITLKATDQIDGVLSPVKESVTDEPRPRLSSRVRMGTMISVVLTQQFLDHGKYEVVAEISYKPDAGNDSEINTEKFTWIFDPPPVTSGAVRLSVGLIRDPRNTSEIGASFIYPDVSSVD